MRDREKQAKEKQDSVLSAWKASREEKAGGGWMKMTFCKWFPNGPASRSNAWNRRGPAAHDDGIDMARVVVGQHEAVSSDLPKRFRRSRADLKDPDARSVPSRSSAPLASARPCSPNHWPKRCSAIPKSLIQLDMSEYMERHNASRMVGSPPVM